MAIDRSNPEGAFYEDVENRSDATFTWYRVRRADVLFNEALWGKYAPLSGGRDPQRFFGVGVPFYVARGTHEGQPKGISCPEIQAHIGVELAGTLRSGRDSNDAKLERPGMEEIFGKLEVLIERKLEDALRAPWALESFFQGSQNVDLLFRKADFEGIGFQKGFESFYLIDGILAAQRAKFKRSLSLQEVYDLKRLDWESRFRKKIDSMIREYLSKSWTMKCWPVGGFQEIDWKAAYLKNLELQWCKGRTKGVVVAQLSLRSAAKKYSVSDVKKVQ